MLEKEIILFSNDVDKLYEERTVIMFFVKKGKIETIDKCLDALSEKIDTYDIDSIVIPLLDGFIPVEEIKNSIIDRMKTKKIDTTICV